MRTFASKRWHHYFRKGISVLQKHLQNEKGEGLLGALGWGVVIVTAIVLVHGLLTGWLPTFVQEKIFNRMNEL
jgi:hypothetical protein